MANATYYVDGATGNDANPGTLVSPFATIGAALTAESGGGNTVYVKDSATYSLTASLIPVVGDATNGYNVIEGYHTTPGDRAGTPIITSSTSSLNLVGSTTSMNFVRLNSLQFTHTGATRGNAIYGGGVNITVDGCVFNGCASAFWAYNAYSGLFVSDSSILNCTSHGTYFEGDVATFSGVYWSGNAAEAIYTDYGSTQINLSRCIMAGGTYGIRYIQSGWSMAQVFADQCAFYGQSVDAINAQDTRLLLSNSLFWGQTGKAVNAAATAYARTRVLFRNNGYPSGSLNNVSAGVGDVTLTANPFTNAAGSDFSLNPAGANYAALKAAGFPSILRGSSTHNYSAIGAAQPAASGAASGGVSLGRVMGGI